MSSYTDFLDAYAEVYPNLSVHAKGYPEPDFLKELFLDDDQRTLYVQTWGGTNTTARALKSIEEEYGDEDDWADIQRRTSRATTARSWSSTPSSTTSVSW